MNNILRTFPHPWVLQGELNLIVSLCPEGGSNLRSHSEITPLNTTWWKKASSGRWNRSKHKTLIQVQDSQWITWTQNLPVLLLRNNLSFTPFSRQIALWDFEANLVESLFFRNVDAVSSFLHRSLGSPGQTTGMDKWAPNRWVWPHIQVPWAQSLHGPRRTRGPKRPGAFQNSLQQEPYS